jgi:hypothetical protein
MDERQFSRVLDLLGQRQVPESLDLWPAIQETLSAYPAGLPRRNVLSDPARRRLRLAVALLLALVVLFTVTPPGRAWAPEIVRFFTHLGVDVRPIPQATLTESLSGAPTPDPASILDASLSVNEVEQQAGFTLMAPTRLPEDLVFAGASYDAERHIARLFYRYVETNGLVLAEELLEPGGTCDLCELVGASAEVEKVQVGEANGEYVTGVWKLTTNGMVWAEDPYLVNLRWQDAGIAFSLQYMGPPGSLTREEMLAIATSLK